MQALLNVLEEYLQEELIIIFGAIGTFIANAIKKKYEEYTNAKLEEKIEKTKEEIVIKCVNAVEQAYKEMTGEEKFQKVVEYVDTLLAEKGITITEVEIKIIIESAVHAMNAIKQEAAKDISNETITPVYDDNGILTRLRFGDEVIASDKD